MRIVSVVGTRPQLIKAAALLPSLRARHEDVFVDTGQHWDEALAGAFFAELDLPRPDHSLGVGGGGHAEQTARMLTALEPILVDERPDAVLVYGDTNSTLAGALAAAKLGIPVAHVEAGLRSFDRRMPEEINRVVSDHLARWCFAPTPAAVANLAAEGITEGVIQVGDLMQDLAARVVRRGAGPRGARRRSARPLGLPLAPGAYLFATVHRAENREPAAIARLVRHPRRCRATRAPGHPGAPPGDGGRPRRRRDRAVARCARRGAAGLSDDARPPAPRRGRPDGFRRRAARGRVARRAVPGPARDDGMGGGGR